MDSIKDRVLAIAPEIREIAHEIHENPELGHQEFRAVELLTGILEKYGFSVTKGVCNLETSFVASYKNKDNKPGPVIGFLAEYDALKSMGHACGHNLIGSLACQCGIALRDAIDEYGGEVRVIGAPAEETDGGKVVLAEAGYYNDLSVAMMGHPFGRHAASGIMYALDSARYEFFGKAAHAGGHPEDGINALNALIETFNMVNALRQHIIPEAKIAGVIIEGGKAANIVPEYAMGEFYIRSTRSAYCKELSAKVRNCAKVAADAMGCEFKYTQFEGYYDDLNTNTTLSDRSISHMRKLGVTQSMEPYNSSGSSDIGNVCYCCPTIHQWVDVTGNPEIGTHTPELCAAADSDYGYEQINIVAQAFVATAEDILTQPDFLAAVKEEFDNITKQ